MYPDYPAVVFVVRGPRGEFPISQWADGTVWVLTANDASKCAEQALKMNQIGVVPSTNLMCFDDLRDIVAEHLHDVDGIAVLDSREEYANLIYTR